MPYPCAHLFVAGKREHWYSLHRQFWCMLCGFKTRHYDSIDAQMHRPVHPHMSVAKKGYNTVKRNRG